MGIEDLSKLLRLSKTLRNELKELNKDGGCILGVDAMSWLHSA
jgi:hypothetical protein